MTIRRRQKKKKRTKTPSEPLYAWAASALFEGVPVDHTWVTTFDLRRNQYEDEKAIYGSEDLYWYCYGLLRLRGRFLGSKNGAKSFSTCLVQPNVRSDHSDRAKGTIFRYARDGVCHQLANQVLFSTGTKGAVFTVKAARGYWFSTFKYGDYGVNVADWEKQKRGCDIGRPNEDNEETEMSKDDFKERAREVLGQAAPDLLRDLLALRAKAMADQPSENNSAASINKKNQVWFDRAADLLGTTRFKQIFGIPPRQRVNLVDPSVMNVRRSEGRKAPQWALRTTTHTQTVNLTMLAAALAELHEMSKKQAQTVLGDLVGDIVKHLKKGERVRIGGLGILQVRKRAARTGRNPATGKTMKIKGHKSVIFRPLKALKDEMVG